MLLVILGWFEMDDQFNTKVYVSNLPLDITEEEFLDMMRKGGVVMRDPETGKMKIKLYTEPGTSQLKGDGLCTYIRVSNFTDMLYMRLWLDDIL
jgi:HIV Tat-specific factor 1